MSLQVQASATETHDQVNAQDHNDGGRLVTPVVFAVLHTSKISLYFPSKK